MEADEQSSPHYLFICSALEDETDVVLKCYFYQLIFKTCTVHNVMVFFDFLGFFLIATFSKTNAK